MRNNKLIRITTVPGSLSGLLKGQLKFMKTRFEVIAISSSGEKLDNVAKTELVRTLPLEMTRTISPINDIKAVIKLYFILKNEKPLIVHSHTPKAGIVAMLASKLAGVPNRLHTVAGLPLLVAQGNKRKILDFVEKLTYSCATKVYPNSFGLYKIILDNNFTSKDKLKVIGNGSSNGIDTSEFDSSLVSEERKNELRMELGIMPNDFVFLFVGRLVKDKGITELVDAFCEINVLHKKAHLVLVGAQEKDLDPLTEITEQKINENSNIHAVGYKQNVIEYFAMADVLTFPSYREGFPNVVMQAASMQLNAIVSDINGCNEIIQNSKNGWVVPAKNTALLKDRMNWCFLNVEISKDMGMYGRKIMQEKYERSYVWQEILNEYNILIQP